MIYHLIAVLWLQNIKNFMENNAVGISPSSLRGAVARAKSAVRAYFCA